MKKILTTEFPKIETERLLLNQPVRNDIENIVEILNTEIYSKYTINIPFPYTAESAEFWIELAEQGFKNKTQYIFAIRTKEKSKLIGGIDLGIESRFNHAELGYWLDETYWNHGYMTEAVRALINFGFTELNLKRIYATHFDFNPASGKVILKCGMEKEGVLKCHTYKDGKYQNHVLYSIINK